MGLGTQVKGHNERRLGVKWEQPGPKLREMILAMRAIWDCWQNGSKPRFEGKFYNFTLMTPFFNPGPIEHPKIPIYIAGVNEYMCQLAGEICEGFHIHPFHSVKYLKEFLYPNVEKGLAKGGRRREDLSMATTAFVITGSDEAEIEAAKSPVRQQMAFYASTRTYKVVLDQHGWGDVCLRLNEKAARGDWGGMAAEITDEMLEVYAVTGTYDEIAAKVKQKYDGLLDRVAFYVPFIPGQDDARWKKIVRAFNG
jgi:probable F420-dependent oxidoreductase